MGWATQADAAPGNRSLGATFSDTPTPSPEQTHAGGQLLAKGGARSLREPGVWSGLGRQPGGHVQEHEGPCFYNGRPRPLSTGDRLCIGKVTSCGWTALESGPWRGARWWPTSLALEQGWGRTWGLAVEGHVLVAVPLAGRCLACSKSQDLKVKVWGACGRDPQPPAQPSPRLARPVRLHWIWLLSVEVSGFGQESELFKCSSKSK